MKRGRESPLSAASETQNNSLEVRIRPTDQAAE
jgi:hypothetical protein